MRAITIVTPETELTTLSENARRYARKARSPNTLRVYRTRFRSFVNFAESRGEASLPATAATVIEYITALADSGKCKMSTIEGHFYAITFAHRAADLPDPTVNEAVKSILSGIRRQLGRNATKKEPATLEEIRAMVATLPKTARGMRNRAILLVGFAGAFRRSELTALDVADVRINGDMRVTLRRSKTDQEGEGMVKAIPTIGGELCPVQAMKDWLNVADIRSGPVFRKVDRWGDVKANRLTAQSVALVVKEAARSAGLDWRAFSGHSLRSGFVTEAMNAGAGDSDIMEITHHKSGAQMRSYRKLTGVGAGRAVRAAFGLASE